MSKRTETPRTRHWLRYVAQHRHPANLLLHLIAVPLFLVSVALLVLGLWQQGFVPLALAIIGIVASLILQAHGHRLEANGQESQRSRQHRNRHLLREQFVTFPCFLLGGAWWRNWRKRK